MQFIHAYVDDETYLMIKSKKINISETVRNLLRNYLEVENIVPEEEAELMKEIESLRDERSRIVKDLSEKSVKLSIIQQHKESERKKHYEDAILLNRGMLESGSLRDPRIGGL
jgi:negative regulator of replication initiation